MAHIVSSVDVSGSQHTSTRNVHGIVYMHPTCCTCIYESMQTYTAFFLVHLMWRLCMGVIACPACSNQPCTLFNNSRWPSADTRCADPHHAAA